MTNKERYFKVTVTRNHRSSFDQDVLIIRMIMEYFRVQGFKFVVTGWELQPKGIHNLHIHALCTLPFRVFIKYADLHNICKINDCVLDIEEIFSNINQWAQYCMKSKYDLAYEYAESTRLTDKGCVFLGHIKPPRYEPTEEDYKAYEQWLKEYENPVA